MRKIFSRKLFIPVFLFLLLELINRIAIDPLYFAALDTFNFPIEKILDSYSAKEIEHVDYLFLGRSRIPAAINPDIFMSMDINSVAINAGRGGSTSAIQYHALKKRISKYPDYIKGAKIFIELPGSSIYTENFHENQFKVYENKLFSNESMPQLLLPYLSFKDFLNFLYLSPNSLSVKIEMTLLYTCSVYRCTPFIHEKLERLINRTLQLQNDNSIAPDGGIRNDNYLWTQQRIIDIAKNDIENQKTTPLLTEQSINCGFIAYFNSLIKKNGGKLYLFDMPLHSVPKQVFNTEKEKNNRCIFEAWAKKNNIVIIHTDKFKYSDSDFPDYTHLGIKRRDEFSIVLYNELTNTHLK